MREVGDEPAVAVEQIDDGRMVHQIGPAVLARDLLVVDAVGARHVGDLLGRAGKADEGRPEIGHIPLEQLRRIAFGDFARGYLIVDRIGIRLLRDPYSSKPYVLFYTTKRVGGGVQNFDAIKLLKIAA